MTIARKQDVYNIRLPKISAASAGMVSERRARQTTPKSNSVCLERPSKVLLESSPPLSLPPVCWLCVYFFCMPDRLPSTPAPNRSDAYARRHQHGRSLMTSR